MIDNLLNPIVLFFILGLLAGLFRSDLKFPESIYDGLSIFLLLAIGLKGGVELSRSTLTHVALPVVATLVLGILIPIIAFGILRVFGHFNRPDSAALAAHYGSVSAVTFAVAISFLNKNNVSYEEYTTALMVILEIPAIAIGVTLARMGLSNEKTEWRQLFHKVFFGKSVFLLIGGLGIGWIAGMERTAAINPLFSDLFKGALSLFLLEMGLIASKRFHELRKVGVFLTFFGIGMPLLSGLLGVVAGSLSGLSTGGTTLLAVLAASASYIAAPAAVRMAIPEANPTYYLTASLGVTFPFNLVVGIPLYYRLTIFVQTFIR